MSARLDLSMRLMGPLSSLLVVAGCVPSVTASYVRSRPAAALAPAEVVATVQPNPLELKCNHLALKGCSAALTLTVHNSGTRSLNLSELRIPCPPADADRCGGTELVYSFSGVHLAPGKEWTWLSEVPIREGVDHLTLMFTDPTSSAVIAVVARDPVRERAEAECRACQGTMERGFKEGSTFCNCTTRDAGATCHRGHDCEGFCIPTGLEVIKTEGDDEWVRPVGRCSERTARPSCRSELPYDEPPATFRRRKGSDQVHTFSTVCN